MHKEKDMGGYTVTITPAGDQAGPQTTIQVDTTSGSARVVEIVTRSADGGGLAPQQLPVIDLVGLIAALAPGSKPAITVADAVAEAPAVVERPTRTRRGRGSAKADTSGPKKSAVARGRRRRAAAAEEPKAGRAYRRMPDQQEVVAAWQQSRSATAVAQHFDVPRHTATGWLRRLRSLGAIESSS
jgi:hypothetical protein